jgi:hypothetical protein
MIIPGLKMWGKIEIESQVQFIGPTPRIPAFWWSVVVDNGTYVCRGVQPTYAVAFSYPLCRPIGMP